MPSENDCHFECVLALPRKAAFALVVDHPEKWWVSPFAANATEDAAIDPVPGGKCYVVTADGQHWNWGTVLSIEEPIYVRFAWQIGPDGQAVGDPSAASRVLLSFRDAGDTTRMEISHIEFVRHGEQADALRERMAGPNGWPRLIARLQEAARAYRAR